MKLTQTKKQQSCRILGLNYLGIMLLCIAMLISFSACSSLFNFDIPGEDNDDEPQYEYEEPAPQPIDYSTAPVGLFPDDGILRLAMRHPLTLNPLLNEDATVAKILRLIFEPLVIFNADLRPTSHLVHLEMASNFASANLTIRHDAIWSDGMPVTSDDLIFSVGVLRNAPDTVIYKRNVANIAHIERVDSRTVVIIFEQASATAAYALNFPIIPEHHFRGHANPASPRNMEPIGNGLYQFDSIWPMLSMTLTRSPYTFRHGATIDEVEVLFIPDADGRLYAFDQGIVDAIRMPFSEWIKHHSVKLVQHEMFPAMYFEFIGFNFQREVFQDIRARQGIAYAFDANEAMSAVYSHQAVRAVSPIHPSSWMHDDTILSPQADLARAVTLLRTAFGTAYGTAFGTASGATSGPPSAAQAEHDDEYEYEYASYPLPFLPIEILVNKEHIERVHIAERLAADITRAGVDAVVVILPFDEYYTRLMEGEFDLFLGGMQLDFAPDIGFMFEESELFGANLAMEALLANLYLALTESAFLQAVSQLQQGFIDELPIISLGFRHSAVLTGTRVNQGSTPASDNIFAFVNEWVIE